MQHPGRIPGLIIAVAMLATPSACVTDLDLDGRDRGAVFPTLRATVPVSGKGPGGAAWEFGVSQGGGTFSTDVPPGYSVDFGGLNTTGPDRVVTKVDLREWYALLATSSFGPGTSPGLAMRTLLGFSWMEMDATVREVSTGTRGSRDDGSGQLMLGFEMGLIPSTGPVGLRARMLGGLGGHSDLITLFGASDVRAVANITPSAEAFAGWRWWNYIYEHANLSSDLGVRLSGPTLGLNLRF